jgi:hypothetical protein
MPAAKYSFKVEQGATLTFNLQWTDDSGTPIDLDTYDSARMQIRSDYADVSGNTLYATLTSSLDSSPSNTGLLLSGSSGVIYVFLSAETTEGFIFEEGLYDLELYKGGVVERLLEGKVTVSKEVTRN